MQRTTPTVSLCCMRKSRGIGYGLCNNEYTKRHDSYFVLIKIFNDITIGNTAVAISRVAMKQSVRRELH